MMTSLSSLFPQVRSLNRAADNIKNVLKTKSFEFQQDNLKNSHGDIIFDDVSFGYTDKEKVLKNISFCAKAGTTTALVGPSGSGKTTIVSLISRFWDVTSGKILIGGTDIRKVAPDALATQMAIVFQDVYLLQETVLQNIKIGNPEATFEDVVKVSKIAHCHEFIQQMPDGYNTIIGEGGSTLSGGEKQRIAIARALLKDAPIILLDETTSSLDADNEKEIQKAFDVLMEGKTVLVIAHRLNTIVNAHNILVLKKGKIEECGTHKQLLNNHGWYAKMIEEQKKAEQWNVKSN